MSAKAGTEGEEFPLRASIQAVPSASVRAGQRIARPRSMTPPSHRSIVNAPRGLGGEPWPER